MRVAAIALAVGLAAASHCGQALAEADSTGTAGWSDRQTLAGDWAGLRSRAADAGIGLQAHYTSESAWNPSGGEFEAVRYTQQVDFDANFDLERLAGLHGGEVLVTMTQRAGRSLSADAIGHNVFAVQEVYGGGQNLRLVEMHYQQALLGDRLLVDIGWEPVGSYFASSPPLYCAYFQTVGACGTLTFNGSWQDYPVSQWGARVRFQPTAKTYIAIGAYQVDPHHGDSDAGFDLGFGGTGAVLPIELGWKTSVGPSGLPGEYKVGAYYDTSRAPDALRDVSGRSAGLTGEPFAEHDGRWAVYALATQMVLRSERGSDRGLSLFGMVSLSDQQTSTFRTYVAAGAIYQGPFAQRPADFIGLVFAQQRFNDRRIQFQEDSNLAAPGSMPIQTVESAVEVDYSVSIAPWLQVRPSLQYVIRPTGSGKIPDALVVGLFTRVTF